MLNINYSLFQTSFNSADQFQNAIPPAVSSPTGFISTPTGFTNSQSSFTNFGSGQFTTTNSQFSSQPISSFNNQASNSFSSGQFTSNQPLVSFNSGGSSQFTVSLHISRGVWCFPVLCLANTHTRNFEKYKNKGFFSISIAPTGPYPSPFPNTAEQI